MKTMFAYALPAIALVLMSRRDDTTGASIQSSIVSADASPLFSHWSAPVNLGPPVNTGAGEAGTFLSRDGLSVYHASSRAGGCGGTDIWVLQRPTEK